jgi:hypothetical protein
MPKGSDWVFGGLTEAEPAAEAVDQTSLENWVLRKVVAPGDQRTWADGGVRCRLSRALLCWLVLWSTDALKGLASSGRHFHGLADERFRGSLSQHRGACPRVMRSWPRSSGLSTSPGDLAAFASERNLQRRFDGTGEVAIVETKPHRRYFLAVRKVIEYRSSFTGGIECCHEVRASPART